MTESLRMAKLAYTALDEKKAEDITIIDISEISVIADYFIIANGTSTRQVQSLVDNVSDHLQKEGFEPKRIEGTNTSHWILVDYGDIIVHVFTKEDRLFYDLERIWKDGKEISIDEL